MMMVTAKSGFWSFKCPCGARFQMNGEKILTVQIIQCPNCSANVDLQNLKGAVESLFGLQQSIIRASQYGGATWQINPPKVDQLVD